MKNWRTTIGGSFSALGVTLMGIGFLPDKTIENIDLLWWTRFVGFIFTGVGTFLSSLWAADAGQLKQVQAQMLEVPSAIEASDTRYLRKSMEEPDKPKETKL